MCKKLLALVLTVSLLGLPVPPARADDSDIFGANIHPNVLLALDTSGSMNDEIQSDPYVAGTPYTGTYDSDKVYRRRSGGGYRVYADTIAEVSSSSARNALTNVGYWSGRIGGSRITLYTGNYLNWLDTPGAQLVKKIVIAKRVLKRLIANVEGVRFGLMRFWNNDCEGTDSHCSDAGGGKIIAPIGSSISDIDTAIDGMGPNGWTPLGEMIRDAGKYYKGQGDYTGGYTTSPIELECQPNFIILVSDGLQNGKVDVRTEATYRRTQDHSSFTGTQNVLVHTVGFAVAAGEEDAANDVLETAATNGGGTFYSTNNETQLEAALEDAIRQIVAATFAFATPVIPTTSATGVSRTFMAAFQSDPSRPYWRGYLKAFNRDSNGNVPVDDTGVPCGPDFSTHTPCTASALAWEAGSVLNTKAAADRVIKTVVAVGGPLVSFDTSNVTAAMLDVASSAEQSKLINFIRGVDTYDEDLDGNTTEQREWKLGDIFHSTPVLVTPPRAPTPESDTVSGSYAEFKKQKEGRTTILVAGSNDGMLHAFRENNGEEIWAFVPPTLPLTGPAPFSKLKDLVVPGGDHQYFADGNPLATDVKISIPSDSTIRWRTIVIFGLRRGGHLYYALDITNTENPIYMWSFTDSKMGETWSTPTVGKVKMADGTDKYVAFVAGGYDTAENNTSGKAVFAIDIATGTKLWEYSAASTGGGSMNFSIPADMTAMDVDANDYIDRLYVGDVGGQVWKFDVSAAATVSGTPALVDNWTGKRIFAANLASETTNPPATGEYYPGQAIYGSIIPAYDNASPKNLWIYFGAGDRNHPNKCTGTLAECPTDPPLRPLNRFYGIKENTSMTGTTPIVESDLVNITNTSDLTPGQGWYYELATREKILASAEIFNKVVYFSSFTPTTTTACASGGGTAKLYAVWMLTGYAALDWSRPGTELANNTDHTEERGKPIGTGIPTRPIVVITEDGATIVTSVIAATTSQQLPSNLTTPPPNMRGVRYWREVFN